MVTIDEDAGIQMDAHGFTGRSCLDEMEKLLDELASDIEITKKPEFDQKEEIATQKKNYVR